MPTSNSAKKRVRQNEKKRVVNQGTKSRIKTLKKNVIAAAEAGDAETVDRTMKDCFSALDKAARNRIYKKKKVARDKSRLCAAVKRSS